jgi:DNA-directed RNA polymerase sigma subunit (sigma70/sigma32)
MRLLDLVIEGNSGLFLAFKKLADDPNAGFSVHAAACVNAAIAKAIAESRPTHE